MDKCKWVIRPGSCNSFFGYTPCKPGYNYLSRAESIDQIPWYNGKSCPICGKPIEIDMAIIDKTCPELVNKGVDDRRA